MKKLRGLVPPPPTSAVLESLARPETAPATKPKREYLPTPRWQDETLSEFLVKPKQPGEATGKPSPK